MGIAAYNRGSRAIGDQLYPGHVRYTASKPKPIDPLPEGILRSGYMPEESLGGTALFLSYKGGWYLIETRWQILKRRRSLDVAAKMFEKAQLFGLCALEGA